MTTYKHTQHASAMVAVMCILAIAALVVSVTVAWPALGAFVALVLAAWFFHSLTIEITDRELGWAFGPGLIRKRVPLAEITSAKPVRTNVFEGWGIHWSRYGWLYNIAGLDAVAITLRNGKRFALGTDEPEILAARLLSKGEPANRT